MAARSQITRAQLCSLLFRVTLVESAELSWFRAGTPGGWDLVVTAGLFLSLLGRGCARVTACPVVQRTENLVSPPANPGLIHKG